MHWLRIVVGWCLLHGIVNALNIQKLIEKGRHRLLQRRLAERLSKENPEKRDRVMAKLFSFLNSTPYIKKLGDTAQQQLMVLEAYKEATGLSNEEFWANVTATFPPELFPPCSSTPYYSDNTLPLPKSSECCPIPEVTCTPDNMFRTVDGSCNCLATPNMGRSNRAYSRILAPEYADGIGKPRVAKSGNPLPSARKVSAKIFHRLDDNFSGVLTVMHMTIGQMVDHDTDRTPINKFMLENGTMVDVDCGEDGCSTTGLENAECSPIPVPKDDPAFTKKCLMFVRSQAFMKDKCKLGPREQPNVVTSWIDCSFVYGSTQADLDLIRNTSDPNRGRMLTSVNALHPHCGDLLPTQHDSGCRDVDDKVKCFLTGDARQNEQNGVTASHVIFVRLHNHFEGKLHEVNPKWDGERLFQEARRLLIAVWQNIIYQEYLPPLLGPDIMKEFRLKIRKNKACSKKYDCEKFNADVSNSFATASFRFGHAQIGDFMRISNVDFHEHKDIPYSSALFRPRALYETHFYDDTCGVEAIFFGHCSQSADKANKFFTEEMTTHMFAENPPKGFGTDLGSLDIERGRDHGLPGYTKWREICQLSVPKSFKDMDDIPKSDMKELKELYEHVDDVDVFVGAMLEDHIPGGIVGPTFACMLAHQFKNLKVADRFWFERCGEKTSFRIAQINNIKKYTLGRFLCDSLYDVKTMQNNPMMLQLEDALSNLNIKRKDIYQKVSLYRGNRNNKVTCKEHPGINFNLWKEKI